MALEFNLIHDPPGDSDLWKVWKHLVDTEGWSSDDHSVTTLTPSLSSTRSVFAVSPKDGSFIGTVVWNEYDNICFLGFFLLAPEFRGKGCGMKIWNAALNRMPKDFNIGLRGVTTMVDKYRKMTTPILSTQLDRYRLSTTELKKVIGQRKVYKSKLVRDFNDEEWNDLMNYDKHITGRDRHEFLKLFYKKIEDTEGLVLYNELGNIIAHIACVPTLRAEDKALKIAPLFAESDDVAFSAIAQFLEVISQKYADFSLLFHVLSTEKGNFLAGFFKSLNLKPHTNGITLYSKSIPSFGDESKVYMAHNNSCHFDY